MAPRRLLSASIAAAIAFVLLCTLGIWQLERLAWKEGLIADITARQQRPPVAYDGGPVDETADFTRATVSGTLRPRESLFMISSFDRGPGWQVITPVLTAGNVVVLVDRGVIPADDRAAIAAAPEAEVTLTGILRRHGEPRPAFLPDNDPANATWYWWDLPAMSATATKAIGGTPAGAVLQLLPTADEGARPRALAPTANLINNHLQYAITWFGLAAALAVITGVFLRGQMRKTGA